ncbi:MAG: CaiB/BaiF CoA-transferase family protein [Archangium sp.]|nr:CaiB/BaiF CoA-transferase family protein [Archangium sp.]MDP3573714.1 CaiB/BaiF CoA-transferase family protein [Archangium sp.]
MSLPLAGLKVLDLSRLLPGPYATLVLADLGAQVDKLEEPGSGDYTRHSPPMKDDTSALFLGLNRNKRSIGVDLKSPEGVATLKGLVKHYDVLVESFRPGVLDRLGAGYEVLSRENPRLIFCSISGYGNTGPDRLKAGHDLNYIARSGALAYGGLDGGAPAMPGVQMADIGGGSLFAIVGILAALHERHSTGQGRFVDVSMTDGSMAFLHMHLAARLLMGAEGTPLARGREALNGGFACYGLYKTKDDRYLAVGSLEPKFFAGVCAAIERPDLLEGAYDVGEGGKKVRAELEEIFTSRTQAEWASLFKPLDLCVEPVLEGDELLNDPQLQARGVFAKEGGVIWLRTPLRFGDVPIVPPPAIGQQTEEILRECGLLAAP